VKILKGIADMLKGLTFTGSAGKLAPLATCLSERIRGDREMSGEELQELGRQADAAATAAKEG
jgi:hypothetical protein